MNNAETLKFQDADIRDRLGSLDERGLDELDFGVIGFDAQAVVCRYNAFESKLAGLARTNVLGQGLFTAVAPCMNNYLVAQRFEDAIRSGDPLDATIDYIFTLRMRPAKVKLRLVASSAHDLRYVLVSRRI